MFIDIPPYVEQMIISQAKEQGISVAQLIEQTFVMPQTYYPKGDIRRLKGIVKTDIKADINAMNEAIAMGAIYGEKYVE